VATVTIVIGFVLYLAYLTSFCFAK